LQNSLSNDVVQDLTKSEMKQGKNKKKICHKVLKNAKQYLT